jgi:hypothetical protein
MLCCVVLCCGVLCCVVLNCVELKLISVLSFSSERAVRQLGYNASIPASDLIAEMVTWQLAENLL